MTKLEIDLGCPLEVVFKALMNGIYILKICATLVLVINYLEFV